MKKALLCLLVVSCLMGLCACGNSPEGGGTSATNQDGATAEKIVGPVDAVDGAVVYRDERVEVCFTQFVAGTDLDTYCVFYANNKTENNLYIAIKDVKIGDKLIADAEVLGVAVVNEPNSPVSISLSPAQLKTIGLDDASTIKELTFTIEVRDKNSNLLTTADPMTLVLHK